VSRAHARELLDSAAVDGALGAREAARDGAHERAEPVATQRRRGRA